ncbi:MAG: SDR family oxidoreductase [Burkholderiaceae bacterium]|nr:SDR family oxidoreductase [Burkholderiaceae bacterium]
MSASRVFVTGAGGYLGSQLVAALASAGIDAVAADVRECPAECRLPGVRYLQADVRSPGLAASMRGCDVVVHLASIVTPGPGSTPEFEYSVDVLGTQNVLEASLAAGVKKIVVSSSGAAYGYHADNPAWITEDQPVRGNDEFAYARHKRLVEEMLARYRVEHPELLQVVFRIGTILGETTRNQITDLFEKPRLIAIRGSDSPFVFVWDQDVVGAILHAIRSDRGGVYNLAGDGALSVRQIADRLGKRCVTLPASLLGAALAVLRRLGLTQYGPEQVRFLRYRPVLDNTRLKRDFGYLPRLTSAQVFDLWLRARELRG